MSKLAASRRKLKFLPFLALYKQRFPSHSYGMVGWVNVYSEDEYQKWIQKLWQPS